MRIAHGADMEYRVVSGHRTGDIKFKRLIQGDPLALDNFEFLVVRNRGEYYTPRHRHNFDQMRYVLEGEFGYADRRAMKAGDGGYFPEGTYYGPQTVTDCTTLVLQCGAPSGNGYLDYTTLGEGHRELARLGSFENGVFTRGEGSNLPGSRRKQDGYEAIWEYKYGRRIDYPPQRYAEPVVFDTNTFPWEETEAAGVEQRLLGTFIQNARMRMYRLQAGAAVEVDGTRANQLLYVLSGAGGSPAGAWGAGDGIFVDRGERTTLTATEPAELILMGMSEIAGVGEQYVSRAA